MFGLLLGLLEKIQQTGGDIMANEKVYDYLAITVVVGILLICLCNVKV